jgi:hypothetical protein
MVGVAHTPASAHSTSGLALARNHSTKAGVNPLTRSEHCRGMAHELSMCITSMCNTH